jgi:hypothetical protein
MESGNSGSGIEFANYNSCRSANKTVAPYGSSLSHVEFALQGLLRGFFGFFHVKISMLISQNCRVHAINSKRRVQTKLAIL